MNSASKTKIWMAGFFLLAMGSVWLEAAGAGNLPTLAIRREGLDMRIDYRGTLQAAGSLVGPWVDVPNAVSPVRELPVGSGRFFRSRQPDGVFFNGSVIRFAITGPMQAGFELAYAGSPDGIFPPVRKKPYFDATVSIAGYVLPVTLRVRGNSSLHECPFPKMKFKVSSENRAGTPFEDAREIDVGTHCAEGGRGNIGRLREESAAYREVLAYEVMELIGFTTPRVRRAQIDYHDNTPPQGHGEVGWTVARSALILEDVDVLAARIGGRALDDLELATLPSASFDHELVARLHLLHVLLGNWDYGLDPEGRGIWNTDVIALDRGGFIPVAGDFDLASWVTEVVRVGFPRDYLPGLPDLDRQARYKLEEIQKEVGDEDFQAARGRFAASRPALDLLIQSALVDGAGRTNAQRHAVAFFDALEAVSGPDPKDPPKE